MVKLMISCENTYFLQTNNMIDFFIKYYNALITILIEMSPFLMLGFLLAGLLKVFVPAKIFSQHLGKSNLSSVIKAAIFGVPLPLCSCGVIPTGISLKKNGASDGATISFLVSTPQTGVDSILVTWSMLGLPFALFRPIVAFITGIAGGVIANFFDVKKPKISTSPHSINIFESENIHANRNLAEKFLDVLKYSFVDFLSDLAKWLVVGIMLAALIDVVIPDDFLTGVSGSIWFEFLIVLAISIPLYVCATGSVPLAAVLLIKGLSPGAAFVFLMAGPATNIATITVLYKTLGLKKMLVYLFTIITGALLAGLFINVVFPTNWLEMINHSVVHHHEKSGIYRFIEILSASLLVGLLIFSFIKMYIMKYQKISLPKDVVAIVEGMSCHHCESNVVRNLKQIEGVDDAFANHLTNEVVIKGVVKDEDQIKNLINSLGYNFKEIKR